MRIMIVDDDKPTLVASARTLRNTLADAEIFATKNVLYAIEENSRKSFDIIFLETKYSKIDGIVLAKLLQHKNPYLNIVFLTSHTEYALAAFDIMASDYILKPLTRDSILRILRSLRFKKDKIKEELVIENKVVVKCFDEFNIYKNGEKIEFTREKAKELLAFLISKRGKEASRLQICDALWSDSSDDKINYFYKIVSELRKTLKNISLEKLLIQGKGKYSIDVNCIERCDYYEYLVGKGIKWNGKFMEQYGNWAEIEKANLNKK